MIYLATPYSTPDKKLRIFRYEEAVRIAGEMILDHQVVYSPIAHNHVIAEMMNHPTNWEAWFHHDSHMLKKADKLLVVMMPGWMTSVGVTAEIELACALKIPVEYLPYESK